MVKTCLFIFVDCSSRCAITDCSINVKSTPVLTMKQGGREGASKHKNSPPK
jgi:hypothetical protein